MSAHASIPRVLDRKLTGLERFLVGALGGLLPIFASLLATDVGSYVDHSDRITTGLFVGICIHIAVLILLGGVMTLLNSEVSHPLTLVQLGIAAPALITSYINNSPKLNEAHAMFAIVSSAYAAEPDKPILVASTFLGDVLLGITGPLGKAPLRPETRGSTRQDPARGNSESAGKTFSILNATTGECFNLTATRQDPAGASLRKSFPQPAYTVKEGAC